MVAIPDNVKSCMFRNIQRLHDRMKCLIPFNMSHDECLELVAPENHLNVLRSAAKYASITASEDWMEVDVPATIDGEKGQKVQLKMRTHAQKEPPLRPRAPEWQAGKKGQVVIDWMISRYELGRKFGLCNYVLAELSARCEQGAQVRYLWPCVVHLCDTTNDDYKADQVQRWHEKHAAFKVCRYLPELSPGLRRAIKETSGTITAAVLIGKDIEQPLPGEVEIFTNYMPSFDYEEVTVLRM